MKFQEVATDVRRTVRKEILGEDVLFGNTEEERLWNQTLIPWPEEVLGWVVRGILDRGG